MGSVPPEERTVDFRGNLFKNVVRNQQQKKRGRNTCLGKSIYKKVRGSSSPVMQTTQEREEFKAELSKLKEEREELARFKEEMKQEREKEKEEMHQEREKEKQEWDLKVKQVNELIEKFGPPRSTPQVNRHYR